MNDERLVPYGASRFCYVHASIFGQRGDASLQLGAMHRGCDIIGWTYARSGPAAAVRPFSSILPRLHAAPDAPDRKGGSTADRSMAQLLNRNQEREWERLRLRGHGAAPVYTRPRLVSACEPLLCHVRICLRTTATVHRPGPSFGWVCVATTGTQMPRSTAGDGDRLRAEILNIKRPRPPIQEDAAYAFISPEVSPVCGQRRFRSVAISTRRFSA